MTRTTTIKKSIICYGIFVGCFYGGCSPQLGANIEVPEIPVEEASLDGGPAHLGVSVSLDTFRDNRPLQADTTEPVEKTMPEGDVGRAVEVALTKSLAQKGISTSFGAPVKISGEIKKWQTTVSAKMTGSLRSEAALYVEVRDEKGQKLFSGTFHGSRASEFPVVTREDVKSSLGFAMSQAINQALEDEQLIQALWSTPKRATLY